ncbi:MAG TPA: RDD family protein [Vicinamibacterales bacterium]|nr:RDD family protein [Vicinamibacterales bacterium]
MPMEPGAEPLMNPYAPPRAAVRDMTTLSSVAERASRATRLGATIVDGLIFTVMVYLPIMIPVIVGAAANGAAPVPGDFSMFLGVGALVALIGFTAWAWITIVFVKRNGQSIGKRLLDVKVVRSDGSPVSLGRLFWLRNVVNGLISIVPLYGIVDILFIFGESRQCLHDKIADTIVVNT